MKILQVESVVPNLINRCAIECLLADFEFDRKDHWPDNESDINAATHSWNVELKENRSC